jgi:hypothetical protein
MSHGVEGILHTVIVDTRGRIVAVTHPRRLTAQHIQDLLDGKRLNLKEPEREG